MKVDKKEGMNGRGKEESHARVEREVMAGEKARNDSGKEGRNGRWKEGGRNTRVEREVMAGGKREGMKVDRRKGKGGGRGKQCQGREGSNGREKARNESG